MNTLKSECQQIIFKAKQEAQEAAFEANARRRELESNIKAKERELATTKRELSSSQKEQERLEKEIEKLRSEQDTLRKRWFEENGKVYEGETTCPHCKQELPAAMIEQARDVFTKAQADKCNEITAKGKGIGERIKELEKEIEDVKRTLKHPTQVLFPSKQPLTH